MQRLADPSIPETLLRELRLDGQPNSLQRELQVRTSAVPPRDQGLSDRPTGRCERLRTNQPATLAKIWKINAFYLHKILYLFEILNKTNKTYLI